MSKALVDLVRPGEIATTGAKPKLPTTIPNLIDTMLDVYRIPLKYLYYNDEFLDPEYLNSEQIIQE